MDPRKKICSFCRLILPSDYQFCPLCGEPLTEGHPHRSPPYESPQEEENPILLDRIGGMLFSPTRKKVIIAGVLLAFVLVMAAAVVGVSMYQKPNTESSIVETATTVPSITPTPTLYPTEYPTATPTVYPNPYETPYYTMPTPSAYPTPYQTYPTPTPTVYPTVNPTPLNQTGLY